MSDDEGGEGIDRVVNFIEKYTNFNQSEGDEYECEEMERNFAEDVVEIIEKDLIKIKSIIPRPFSVQTPIYCE